MDPETTYDELTKKVARLEKDLIQCRNVQKRLKQDLAENAEGMLQVLFDASHDNVLLLDPDGTVLAINAAAAKGLRKTPDEIVGGNIYNFLTQRVVDARKAQALKVVTEKQPISFSEKSESRALEWHIYPVFADDGEIVKLAVFGQDITGRKNLEKQLQEARKMDALGTLAGGIAHQFNNALTGITGNIGLLEMDLPDDHNFIGNINDMKASAHKMVHLTKQLLAYAQGGRYHLQTTPIRDFLVNTLALLEHTLKPSVRLETDLPLDLMQVKADRTQMQMVVSAIVAVNVTASLFGSLNCKITRVLSPISTVMGVGSTSNTGLPLAPVTVICIEALALPPLPSLSAMVRFAMPCPAPVTLKVLAPVGLTVAIPVLSEETVNVTVSPSGSLN